MEELYNLEDPDQFDDRWRILWSPLRIRNGIEFSCRDQKNSINETIKSTWRSRFSLDKWQVGIGIRTGYSTDRDSLRWAGFIKRFDNANEILIGDFKASSPDGLLLANHSYWSWQSESEQTIVGSIDPSTDLRGIGIKREFGEVQFAIGGGDEREKSGKRVSWSTLNWSNEATSISVSSLFLSNLGSFNSSRYQGSSMQLNTTRDYFSVIGAITANKDGKALHSVFLSNRWGKSRIEWYGRQGLIPDDRSNMRLRNLRQGIFIEQTIERSTTYWFAAKSTLSVTGNRSSNVSMATSTPDRSDCIDTRIVAAKAKTDQKFQAGISIRKVSYGDSWGLSGDFRYLDGSVLDRNLIVSAYALKQYWNALSITGWITGISGDHGYLPISVAPLTPQLTLSGSPSLNQAGGYLGGSVKWQHGDFFLTLAGWGLVFTASPSNSAVQAIQLTGGYLLQ